MAEVLITLGIIGVVAAMTMPTLMANHKRKEYAVRAKQAYSMLAQAIKLSEVQNDDVKYWDLKMDGAVSISNTAKVFQKYILPYLSNAELCGEGIDVANTCGVPVSMDGQSYLLGNGVALSFVVTDLDNVAASLYFMVDVNGKKGPNLLGTDAFYFVLYEDKGLMPYGWDLNLSREDILNGTKSNSLGYTLSCKAVKDEDNDKDAYRHGCTALLMIDGWEFKSDYPFTN